MTTTKGVKLQVWTARIDYEGPDRLDITRAAESRDRRLGIAPSAGSIFAPSWRIVTDAKRKLDRALRLKQRGRQQEGDRIEKTAWNDYKHRYTEEMRQSYAANRRGWIELLSSDRVVLVCYCLNPRQCHRTLLSSMLGTFGATERGEIRDEPLLARAAS